MVESQLMPSGKDASLGDSGKVVSLRVVKVAVKAVQQVKASPEEGKIVILANQKVGESNKVASQKVVGIVKPVNPRPVNEVMAADNNKQASLTLAKASRATSPQVAKGRATTVKAIQDPDPGGIAIERGEKVSQISLAIKTNPLQKVVSHKLQERLSRGEAKVLLIQREIKGRAMSQM